MHCIKWLATKIYKAKHESFRIPLRLLWYELCAYQRAVNDKLTSWTTSQNICIRIWMLTGIVQYFNNNHLKTYPTSHSKPINQQQSNAHVTNNECTKVRKTPNVLNNWYVQYSEMTKAIYNVYYIYNSQGLASEG